MIRIDLQKKLFLGLAGVTILCAGCTGTIKAVGDPDRPITINAHITLDIKGLKDTATNIEDYVAGGRTEENSSVE